LGSLDLDEITDVNLVGQTRTRTQPRVRTDSAMLAGHDPIEVRIRSDNCAGADFGVLQYATGTHFRVIGQGHFALEYAVRIDGNIEAAHQFSAHIETPRVGQRHAFSHQLARAFELVNALQVGELFLAVDAKNFPGLGRMNRAYQRFRGKRQGHDVGEVVLLLRISIGQLFQPFP